MDTLFASINDEHWGGYINPMHRRMIERFLALCPSRACILYAAYGTRKSWPLLRESGRSVLGIDHSAGMLEHAASKFPATPVCKLALQDIDVEREFDGVVCIDALELIFPEDWPRVLARFHRALKPGGPLYFTVELAEEDLPEVFQLARVTGLPFVASESVKEGTYHYYPAIDQVRAWLEQTGFDILQETVGDGYYQFIVRRRETGVAPRGDRPS